MKRHLLFLVAILFFTTILSHASSGQTTPQAGDDKVYSRSEVDTQAVIERGQHPRTDGGCARGSSGTIRFDVILRRSGVTEIVESPLTSGCAAFDRNAYNVLKNLKFKPAIKNGEAVSVSMKIEYNYSTY